MVAIDSIAISRGVESALLWRGRSCNNGIALAFAAKESAHLLRCDPTFCDWPLLAIFFDLQKLQQRSPLLDSRLVLDGTSVGNLQNLNPRSKRWLWTFERLAVFVFAYIYNYCLIFRLLTPAYLLLCECNGIGPRKYCKMLELKEGGVRAQLQNSR